MMRPYAIAAEHHACTALGYVFVTETNSVIDIGLLASVSNRPVCLPRWTSQTP